MAEIAHKKLRTVVKQHPEERDVTGQIRFDIRIWVPLLATLLTLAVEVFVPNDPNLKYGELQNFRNVLIFFTVSLFILGIISLFAPKLRQKVAYRGWFIGGLILFINAVNLVTAKFILLPQIYFPSLDRIFEVFLTEYQFLLSCLGNSFKLLVEGVLVGASLGIITGIIVGWSKRCNYWINPIVRILGPIPTSTWIPLALVAFPSARAAAVYVIAFGVWFQLTILTSSGIQSVKKSYYEVSSTLGASNLQNLFNIAIPDALPSMFLGLFNATCTSFAALVVAEMIGVKSGIGWYINWQKEMMSYANVYAGLWIIAGFCYLFITIQFRVRNKVLSWQKGVIKW